MTRYAWLLLPLLILAACAPAGNLPTSSQPYGWSFDRSGDSRGWTPGNALFPVVAARRLKFHFTGDSYILSPANLRINPRQYGLVVISAKSWNAGDKLAVTWQSQRSVQGASVELIDTGDAFHTYYVDLAQNPQWEVAGMVDQFAIMPTMEGAEGDIEIRSISLVPRSLDNLARFYASELMRPEYLSTQTAVNVIDAPALGEMPLMVLLYALLFAAAVGVLVVHARSWGALGIRLSKKAGPAFMTVLLVVWTILSLRLFVDQWHTVGRDSQLFAGKSAVEKQDQVGPSEYRQFLETARERLPQGARVGLVVNTLWSHQGQYYLYPLQVAEPASYYLVYDFPQGDWHAQYDAASRELRTVDENGRTSTVARNLVLLDKPSVHGFVYEVQP